MESSNELVKDATNELKEKHPRVNRIVNRFADYISENCFTPNYYWSYWDKKAQCFKVCFTRPHEFMPEVYEFIKPSHLLLFINQFNSIFGEKILCFGGPTTVHSEHGSYTQISLVIPESTNDVIRARP